MRLFIDTNIFLSFYHLTSDDLEELQKLAALIEGKEIMLLLPQQVIDETLRTRSSKINEGFDSFKKFKFSLRYPAYCKDYDQYLRMREAEKTFEAVHSEIVKKIQSDIDDNKLKADLLLRRLFGIAKIIERSPEIVAKARARADLGNPPGKKGSLGDAVNWESLLFSVPENSALIIVTDDSDFYSPLDGNKLNEFLHNEWMEAKKSDILFYRKLSSYFKHHYPNINLQAEQEKDHLIERLAASGSFATTHSLIAELSKYDEFTQKQIEELVDALLMNNQVHWIIDDEDVHQFYEKLYDRYLLQIWDHADELNKLLYPPNLSTNANDEIPGIIRLAYHKSRANGRFPWRVSGIASTSRLRPR